MNAKQYLDQIGQKDRQINNKIKELAGLRELSTNITAQSDSERVQSSISGDKTCDIVAKIVDMQNEINWLIDEFVDLRQEVIRTIENLAGTYEYDVLHKRYVQFMTFDAIADSIIKKNGECMSRQGIYIIHKKALKKVENFL